MSCNNSSTCAYQIEGWKFNHSKLENQQECLKSNDTINLCINKINSSPNGVSSRDFLRSHDVQFDVGNRTFQEVVCHNKILGANDEVSKFYFIIFICNKY